MKILLEIIRPLFRTISEGLLLNVFIASDIMTIIVKNEVMKDEDRQR